MNNFRIDQRIVCIDDDWGLAPLCGQVQHWPKKGDVYTVRAIIVNGSNGKVFIRLREIVNPETDKHHEAEFWAECFRPVVERKTDISVFQRLLQPNPENVV